MAQTTSSEDLYGTIEDDSIELEQNEPKEEIYEKFFHLNHLAPVHENELKTYAEREREYYSDYDPAVGLRIAAVLSVLIIIFAVFVLYKSHCNAKRNRRLIQNAQMQFPMNVYNQCL